MKSPLTAMLLLILTWTIPNNICLANDDLDISALKLVYDRHLKKATFTGNVVLCFDNIKLTSQKIIFTFQDTNRKKIETVEIPGKLRAIKSENGIQNVILADSGIYTLEEQTLTLKGNVAIEDKKDIIITDKMIYHGKLKKIAKHE